MKGKRVFRFYLIDFYEEEEGELVHSSDSMEEIKEAATKHINEVGGECILVVADWETRKMKIL